jgi:hypothetical protein
MQDPDLRPSRRAVCAALIQCCRSTNCHEMRRPRSSAPLAGRARRRRSGSTSVRDNLAHLVDDETQHDHARYDGARWHRPSRQQHGLAPSRSGAASLRGYRSVCGSCVRFLSLAVLQPVSPGFDVPEAARRSSAAIHSPSNNPRHTPRTNTNTSPATSIQSTVLWQVPSPSALLRPSGEKTLDAVQHELVVVRPLQRRPDLT